MFGCNDTPPAPPPPHPSFSFDHGVGQSSYSNLNSSSIKLPLINNFIDEPQQYDDASLALGFTPVGVAGTVGKTSASLVGKIMPYNALRNLTKGTGLQAHHLIEKRFGKLFDVNLAQKSIALTKESHQVFTNEWRKLISYGKGTRAATREGVMTEARKIYEEYPDIFRELGL